NLTADAAFDAICLYQGPAERGGIAAIALNLRGNPSFQLGPNDHPLCSCNTQEMRPISQWVEDGQRLQRFRCPDCGRVRKMNIERGNLMRWRLDRHSPAYQAIYKQRTSAERINSQAKALGIERPPQRRIAPIARRNTLIYIVINIRAIFRYHERSINSS
ncbi:MAG TPA: transposase, partial [Aggregatilineales bacterium]|nr:transposase [Aggregatilineales bacterium]